MSLIPKKPLIFIPLDSLHTISYTHLYDRTNMGIFIYVCIIAVWRQQLAQRSIFTISLLPEKYFDEVLS